MTARISTPDAAVRKTITSRRTAAWCQSCEAQWATRNAAAVAAIHARTFRHRVDVAMSVEVTFTGGAS